MAYSRKGNQRPRNRGDPSWYDKSFAPLSADQTEVPIELPSDKVGLVIGRKGRTIQEIREQTGAKVYVKDNKAYLRGTEEQCQKAKKIIEEILNPVSLESSFDTKR